MNRPRFFFCSLFFLLFGRAGEAQIPFRVLFYNVENLFDAEDNPRTSDDEFLPSGSRRWTFGRYHHKLKQLSRVILAAGEWDTPALIGLCEVENDSVVEHLLRRTPLRSQQYRYVTAATADPRGIRTALLWQGAKFRYLGSRSIRLHLPSHPTRDFLHVWGKLPGGDTLDVFVCHFPSKYSGERETESARLMAARSLRRLSDSLFLARRHPLQILMGDFNAEPGSSVCQILAEEGKLLPLFPKSSGLCSYKYHGVWQQIDHIFILPGMIEAAASLRLEEGSPQVFHPSFLLCPDKTYLGKRPFRTYYGFKHEGGFSDHLPVMADFLAFPR
jgi:endonuclease/exonuclease/phosphatase family metal-dependent hydrolase